jgi:lysozyme
VPKSYLSPCPQSSWPVGGSLRFRRPPAALLRAATAVAVVAAVTATSAGAASAAVIGPDVSSNNHGHGVGLNWRVIHGVGRASFVFIKATEGGGYRNPSFSSDFAAAGRYSLIRGAYQFARPGGTNNAQIVSNATAEAVQFGHTIGTLNGPGNLPPVLDLETAGGLSPSQLSLWTRVWLERMTKLTGRTSVVYTNVSFWRASMGNTANFATYPLWLASYGVSRPAMVGGWKSYTFWQYTETGRMAGSGANVDLSVFNGSLAQLTAMTVTAAAAAAAAAAVAAARAAAAAAAVAAKRAPAAAAATAAAGMTLKLTTRAATTPAGTTQTGANSSHSGVRSGLGVFGFESVRTIPGY